MGRNIQRVDLTFFSLSFPAPLLFSLQVSTFPVENILYVPSSYTPFLVYSENFTLGSFLTIVWPIKMWASFFVFWLFSLSLLSFSHGRWHMYNTSFVPSETCKNKYYKDPNYLKPRLLTNGSENKWKLWPGLVRSNTSLPLLPLITNT